MEEEKRVLVALWIKEKQLRNLEQHFPEGAYAFADSASIEALLDQERAKRIGTVIAYAFHRAAKELRSAKCECGAEAARSPHAHWCMKKDL